jgi:intein-encoded DNA endonuclease-like protein
MDDSDFHAGYVVGVLCSDGNMVWDEKHGNYSIHLETRDGEFAGIFLGSLSRIFDKKPKTGKKKRCYKGQESLANMVSVYGKSWIQEFASKWGIEREPWSVPRKAFTNAVFRTGFLRGFFDGNGNVNEEIRTDKSGKTTKKRYIRLYSVNESGMKDVKRLLETEGIRSLFYPTGKCFSLKISGKTRLDAFRQRINFGISRKKTLLDKALLPFSVTET